MSYTYVTAGRRSSIASLVRALSARRSLTAATAGSLIVTAVPRPFSLSTAIVPATQLDVAARDRQAEAGAGRLGGEVGLEDARRAPRRPCRCPCPRRESPTQPSSTRDGQRADDPGPASRAARSRRCWRARAATSVRSTRTGGSGPATSLCRCDPSFEADAIRLDDVVHELHRIGRRAARGRRRREARELRRDLTQQPDLPEDRVDAALEHRPERLAAIRVDAPQVFRRQLDRRQRVLDLVRDLARHLGPGLEAMRALELIALRLQLRRHAVERVDQPAQLVGRADGDARVEVAARDAAGRARQLPDRIGDALGHRQPDRRRRAG